MFKEHTFSICAYGESEFLEACIKSLKKQTMQSNIIMCTSSPNPMISELAQKYKIPLYVRKGQSDIRDDWNFAYNKAETRYVTLVHQDDCYNKKYCEDFYRAIQKYKNDFTIYYSSYRPIKHGEISTDKNCIIRAFCRLPLNFRPLAGLKCVKLATLSLGNSICCPAVTYNKNKLGKSIFTSELKFNIDWDTFYKLAYIKGKFIYNNRILTYYRIHDKATSKSFIDDNARINEDIIMFDKFWPHFITMLIMKLYKHAYSTYLN